MNLYLSLYRYLANAYPHEFRMVYGEDLDRMGEDAVPEAWRRYGLFGLVRLLADIAVRAARRVSRRNPARHCSTPCACWPGRRGSRPSPSCPSHLASPCAA